MQKKINPEKINRKLTLQDMSHHKGSFSARNLSISIKLMESDDNVNMDGLPLFYSRSVPSGYVSRVHSSVAYLI